VTAFTAVPREDYSGGIPKGKIGDEGHFAAATAARYPNIDHVFIRSGHRSPVERLDRDFFLFDRPALNLCNMVWMNAINDDAKERGLSVMLTGQVGNMSLTYGGIEWLPELLLSGRLLRLWQVGAALVGSGSLGWRGFLTAAIGPFLPASLWERINRLAGRSHDLREYSAIAQDRIAALDLAGIARERGLDFGYRPRRDGFETRVWVLRRMALGSHNKGILAGWGIDQRDPTADRRLIEYCLGLPMEAFVAGGRTRGLARRALADRLPAVVLEERRKGLQAVDWHEGATAARADIAAEVERFAQCDIAHKTLDTDRLRALLDDWPERSWDRPEITASYRLALLRGVAGGHFMRKAARTNG
jgi:asparagine synthase (glutamine-hydrolysing)